MQMLQSNSLLPKTNAPPPCRYPRHRALRQEVAAKVEKQFDAVRFYDACVHPVFILGELCLNIAQIKRLTPPQFR